MYGDEYVVVGTRAKTESMVYVVDGESMITVGEYHPTDAITDSGFSGVGIMNNRIYACDHSPSDTILVSEVLNIPEKVVAVETEAEVVDTAVEAGAAPATFDMGIVAAVAAIVSAAGYAISKKR